MNKDPILANFSSCNHQYIYNVRVNKLYGLFFHSEIVAEGESGIEGMLSRLEKERNVTFGAGFPGAKEVRSLQQFNRLFDFLPC